MTTNSVPEDDSSAADGEIASNDREPDPNRRWHIMRIDQPIAGLDELYENDRARYAHHDVERLLGLTGRMIGQSKSGYRRAYPDHVPVFNANVCTRERGKIWFGDLDLTLDEPVLAELARMLNEHVYVLTERRARFGNEHSPDFDSFVAIVAPNGPTTTEKHIARAADGSLRRKGLPVSSP
jgi:hypothetical protein